VEDSLEVREFLHHGFVGIDVGSLKNNIEFLENVLEDPRVGHEGVELPG
jgi:hypothetical protein